MSARRAPDHLTPEIRAFLRERRFAVLATINPDGTPHLSPVWYDLQGKEVMMNTRRGRRKDRNMRRDPRVTFSVEDGYRYVTLTGSVELIDEESVAQTDIRRLAARYEGDEDADRRMREQFSREPRVTMRMRIQHAFQEGF